MPFVHRSVLNSWPTGLIAVALASFWGCPHQRQVAESQDAVPKRILPAADRSAVPTGTVDRSPVAVALSPDRRFAAAANHSSGTVSLIDLFRGAVRDEIEVGRHPADLAWVDQTRFVVTVAGDDALVMVSAIEGRLTKTQQIPVGDEPRGVVVATDPTQPTSRRAWIAVSNEDRLVEVDLNSGQVARTSPVGALPQYLALSPNGKWLITGCNGAGDVYVHDVVTGTQLNRRAVFDDPANMGRPAVLSDSLHAIFPHIVNRSFPVNEDNIEKGWVIDNRLTRLDLPQGEYWQQSQIALDTRGDAVGDANAVAVSPDGRWLVVSCGGTHELLIFLLSALRWPQSGPGDFIPSELLNGDGVFRRLKLGGRPVDLEFLDDQTLVVSNYLANSVQVVDVAAAKVLTEIPLGGSANPSPARRGEAIFYDADRSLNSWFSCHTCHIDGHTNGRTFDTLNDKNFDTYKLTPTLRGVVDTGPWTWHGWQADLKTAIRKSMKDTMRTRAPVTDRDVDDLHAYFATLQPERSPHRGPDDMLPESARRGWALFTGKGGCAGCHAGTILTSPETFDVGTGSLRYVMKEFNPPSLRGLHSRRRFLHDGRAKSLADVLTKHHRPENVAGESLNDSELADLLEYLATL